MMNYTTNGRNKDQDDHTRGLVSSAVYEGGLNMGGETKITGIQGTDHQMRTEQMEHPWMGNWAMRIIIILALILAVVGAPMTMGIIMILGFIMTTGRGGIDGGTNGIDPIGLLSWLMFKSLKSAM